MGLSKGATAGILDLAGPGRTRTREQAEKVEQKTIEGLELSEIRYMPLSFFRPNPDNAIFDEVKDGSYFMGLKRDIDEARAIINPLIVTMDGLIIEGHSRYRIALELEAEGRSLGPLPCRNVISSLTDAELRNRVYLGNLSRFEIPEALRDLLYSRIWPGFFYTPPKKGRPAKNNHGEQLPVAGEIADQAGTSELALNRSRAYFARALEIAKAEGREEPSVEDLAKAREEKNADRRKKESKALGPAGKRIAQALDKLDRMATKAEDAAAGGRAPDKNMAKAEGLREAIAIVKTALEGRE